MSLSLSSLLNPSPDAEANPTSPPLPRKDSLPPIQYLQSPDQQQYAPPFQSAQQYHHPPVTEHEAVQALAALSTSAASPPIPSQWYGQSAPEHAYDRRSASYERRPGSSGYGEPMQLPPPPPSVTGRKTSSPTLDQYHVASRSPEQRRASLISPAQSSITLPPIQRFTSNQGDQTGRPSLAHEHVPAAYEHSHVEDLREEKSLVIASSSVGRDRSSGNQSGISTLIHYSPPARLQISTSDMLPTSDEFASSPALIKQEAMPTPRTSSPVDARRMSIQDSDANMNGQSLNATATASLKKEKIRHAHSPLRESSVPVPSTELTAPEPTIPKKRPAPSKTKKGTATTTKKAPPAKKRKVEMKRSITPSSRASKPPTLKTGSTKGTPANFSPQPSTRSQSHSPADDEAYDEDDDNMDEGDYDGSDSDVYCICRKPDNGTFMIGCDGTCDDWFHGKCVGIEERDKNLIDKYVCPNCTKLGAGRTTWKRMCRRVGCRLPARVGKSKNGGKDGSKYCSEECGVLYFREMVARTRGREDVLKNRSSRRKNSVVSGGERPNTADDDLGARGGVLAAGEIRGLLDSSKTAEDFKRLGEGVLSPPATPTSPSSTAKRQENGGGDGGANNSTFTPTETATLQRILAQKDDARRTHQLLKDRMKFVTLAKQAAAASAAERDLKAKEFCGYDSRLEWSGERFATWRGGKVGRRAFEVETLAAVERSGRGGDGDGEDWEEDEVEICDRKKCARHYEWGKLAVDDVRFEMADNGDRMRGLDREERVLREGAALRAKRDGGLVGGEGRVEMHFGLGILGVGEAAGDEAEAEEEAKMEKEGGLEAMAMAVDAVV